MVCYDVHPALVSCIAYRDRCPLPGLCKFEEICMSCIKGHRSTSCHHNDRPLFEIKKKGRPVSQCQKCREARQSRRIHGKCTCDSDRPGGHSNNSTKPSAASSAEGAKKKGKRFIPSVPTLPNGLKDVLGVASRSSSESSAPKQPVGALLNPCHCGDLYNCKCCTTSRANVASQTDPTSSSSKGASGTVYSDGLSALALAASCCSPATQTSVTENIIFRGVLDNESNDGGKTPSSFASQLNLEESLTMGSSRMKRKRYSDSPPPQPRGDNLLGDFPLPSFFRPIAPASSRYRDRSPLPALSHTDITKSNQQGRCCCGTRCECVGCTLHNNTNAAEPLNLRLSSTSPLNQIEAFTHAHTHIHPADCPTCVDYTGGIELPRRGNASYSPSPPASPSCIDVYFDRVSSVPSVTAPIPLSLATPTSATTSRLPPLDSPSSPHALATKQEEDCCSGRRQCEDDDCEGSCINEMSKSD